jgi:hypothetical protein
MKKYFWLFFLLCPGLAMADIARALQNLRPGAKWQLNGDTYEGIIWLDAIQTKPTKSEVTAALSKANTDQGKDYCRFLAIQRLRDSEWVMASDSTVSNIPDWKAYRAVLWDLAAHPVESPVFPAEPAVQF